MRIFYVLGNFSRGKKHPCYIWNKKNLLCRKLCLIFLIILFLFTDGNKRAEHKKLFKNLLVTPLFYSSLVTGKKNRREFLELGPFYHKSSLSASIWSAAQQRSQNIQFPPLAVQLKQKYLAHKLARADFVFLCKKATFQQVKRSHFIVPPHQLHYTAGGPKEKRTHHC